MHSSLDIMGSPVAGSTLVTELINNGLAMRHAMTLLAFGKITVNRMTEGTGQFRMSGVALHQNIVFLCMTTLAGLFGFGWQKDHLQRIMRIDMAAQTVFGRESGPMFFMVMTCEAGRNFAVLVMAAGAGYLGEML